MNFLEERIIKDGIIREGNVLKVDSFLNHQIDVPLLEQMGAEFKKRFAGKEITKILTIEASGIGIACIVARYFNVPVDGDKYCADVYSFTHKCTNHVFVSKKYIAKGEKILIIDDFLANGAALLGLTEICRQAQAEVVGIGIAIEKGFQDGGKIIREKGFQLESIAIVDAMDAKTGKITFR